MVLILNIRILKEEDIPQMLDLYSEFLKDLRERDKYFKNKEIINNRTKEIYLKMIKSDNMQTFVGVDNQIIAGFSSVAINEPGFIFDEKNGYIYDGFVMESYRRTTLVFKLFNACENWAKKQGCRYITSCTHEFNKGVQAGFIYEKMEPYKTIYVKKLAD